MEKKELREETDGIQVFLIFLLSFSIFQLRKDAILCAFNCMWKRTPRTLTRSLKIKNN